jgi:cytochrome c oxidase subunit I
VWNSRRLVLAHLWFAFAGFVAALPLGEWQMFVRSPLHAWISDPEWYYRSVTAHGTTMAYVFPTLVAMGFGYFVTEHALKRPMVGLRWAWLGFALVVIGTVAAIVPVALGRASVLYTFYPPLIGHPSYYIGVVLVVVGSWVWVALMSINMYRWKRDNPGAPVPFPMFATATTSSSTQTRWKNIYITLRRSSRCYELIRSMPDPRSASSPPHPWNSVVIW